MPTPPLSAAQEQEPKDHRKPQLVGVDEESERVAYRVLSHAKSREDQQKCGRRTPDMIE